MLVLSRKPGEKLIIGDNITIEIIDIRNGGSSVRIGITAPAEVPVHREEVYEAIKREQSNDRRKTSEDS